MCNRSWRRRTLHLPNASGPMARKRPPTPEDLIIVEIRDMRYPGAPIIQKQGIKLQKTMQKQLPAARRPPGSCFCIVFCSFILCFCIIGVPEYPISRISTIIRSSGVLYGFWSAWNLVPSREAQDFFGKWQGLLATSRPCRKCMVATTWSWYWKFSHVSLDPE